MRRRFLFLPIMLVLLSGCLGTKQLKENEFLVYSQKLEGNSKFKTDRLEPLIAQKPNPRLPFLPVSIPVWSYQQGLKSFDTARVEQKLADTKLRYERRIEQAEDNTRRIVRLESRRDSKIRGLQKKLEEGNWLMRRGEAPSTYNLEAVQKSLQDLRLFYFSEGYFNAKTSHRADTVKKRILETYLIEEGKYYQIDTIFYRIPDSTVFHLVQASASASFVKEKTRFRQENFNRERDRLENLLKNTGYFDFNRQFIEFNLDTTWTQYGIAIEIAIRNPTRRPYHRQFTLDSVVVVTDAEGQQFMEGRDFDIYNKVTYSYFDRKYNERILDRKIMIRPGDLYNRQKTLDTQRQLFNLDLFKFANIVYDTTGGSGMLANIYMSPLPKWQFSTEAGVNVTQGLPGPMVNFNLRDRNVLRTLGILEFSGRFTVEGVAGAATQQNVFRSIEMGSNISLILPGLVAPFSDRLPRSISGYNPRTRFSVGFTSTNRPEYNRSNFNATFGYQWITPKNHSFTLNLIDVSLIESRIKSQEFQDRLQELADAGNNLIFSFQTSYSSAITAQAIFNFNEYGNRTRTSSLLRAYLESNGTFLPLYRKLIEDQLNLLSFRFLKGQVEYRQHIPLNRNTQFAWRGTAGLAYSYTAGAPLPYEKYFFSGGSNSVRAWAPRRLGPGSFLLLGENGRPDYRFEQPGEVMLEFNAEIRRKLFGFFQGAFFVDAGNVWFARTEPIPGGMFEFNDFISEIGIGTGLGLRLDFEFLIMRFDAGIKAYNPGLPQGERWVIKNLSWDRPFGERNQTVFNIAIGYPF